MSFSRTRPLGSQQQRRGGNPGGAGLGVFCGFRSAAFPNQIGNDLFDGKCAGNGVSFAFAGDRSGDVSCCGQLQRPCGALDDFILAPSMKRRKSEWEGWRSGVCIGPSEDAPSTSDCALLCPVPASGVYNSSFRSIPFNSAAPSPGNHSGLQEDDTLLMSRDEIERCSPSRKDGIDLVRETHLRYTYCAFLQNLGMRLELPQTTIGTAMVLCHRFFVRRSHACHDRFLIATAALFLAAKSEETPCPLNTVLRASCEICLKHNPAFFSYLLPIDWFEQYREHVIEAEQMILTTLNFELDVQHPYTPLTSVLDKLGLAQTVLVNLAWCLINEGALTRMLCSNMWYS